MSQVMTTQLPSALTQIGPVKFASHPWRVWWKDAEGYIWASNLEGQDIIKLSLRDTNVISESVDRDAQFAALNREAQRLRFADGEILRD